MCLCVFVNERMYHTISETHVSHILVRIPWHAAERHTRSRAYFAFFLALWCETGFNCASRMWNNYVPSSCRMTTMDQALSMCPSWARFSRVLVFAISSLRHLRCPPFAIYPSIFLSLALAHALSHSLDLSFSRALVHSLVLFISLCTYVCMCVCVCVDMSGIYACIYLSVCLSVDLCVCMRLCAIVCLRLCL